MEEEKNMLKAANATNIENIEFVDHGTDTALGAGEMVYWWMSTRIMFKGYRTTSTMLTDSYFITANTSMGCDQIEETANPFNGWIRYQSGANAVVFVTSGYSPQNSNPIGSVGTFYPGEFTFSEYTTVYASGHESTSYLCQWATAQGPNVNYSRVNYQSYMADPAYTFTAHLRQNTFRTYVSKAYFNLAYGPPFNATYQTGKNGYVVLMSSAVTTSCKVVATRAHSKMASGTCSPGLVLTLNPAAEDNQLLREKDIRDFEAGATAFSNTSTKLLTPSGATSVKYYPTAATTSLQIKRIHDFAYVDGVTPDYYCDMTQVIRVPYVIQFSTDTMQETYSSLGSWNGSSSNWLLQGQFTVTAGVTLSNAKITQSPYLTVVNKMGHNFAFEAGSSFTNFPVEASIAFEYVLLDSQNVIVATASAGSLIGSYYGYEGDTIVSSKPTLNINNPSKTSYTLKIHCDYIFQCASPNTPGSVGTIAVYGPYGGEYRFEANS